MSKEEIDASGWVVSSELFDQHFPMVNNYGQPCISTLSTMLLGLEATTLSRPKGIKLGSGVKFHYNGGKKPEAGKKEKKVPQKKHVLYLYEAGVSPNHLEALQHNIHIYVTRRKDKDTLLGPFAVATLSPARPTVPLELTLGEDCYISHSSKRKAVFFNGFLFPLLKKLVVDKEKRLPDKVVWIRPKSVTLEAKELWVAEVKPSQELEVSPIDEGKEYHLLKVYSKKNTQENIDLHVRCNGKMELMGELVTGCNPIRFNTMFDDDFSLSHTSNTTAVIFYGYTMPFQFKLKDLNKYQESGKHNQESGKHNLKASPKISLDPEYQSYQAILAKVPIAPSMKPIATSKEQPIATSKEQPIATSRQPLIAPLIFARLHGRSSLRAPLGRKQEILDGRRATSNIKALDGIRATSNIKISVKNKCKKNKHSRAAEDAPEEG